MMLASLYGPRPGLQDYGWLEDNYLRSYRKCYVDLEQVLDPAVMEESAGRDALKAIILPFMAGPRQGSF